MSGTPVDMAKVAQMLDNGWSVRIYRNGLGTYTARATHLLNWPEMRARLREKLPTPLRPGRDAKAVYADDFTPGQALTRLAYKVHGEVVGRPATEEGET